MEGFAPPFLRGDTMNRITVFHGNKKEFKQAVITENALEYFKKLGFVESVDKLKAARNANKKD